MNIGIIKQAFKLNKNPFPWEKALSAALCGGFPVLIGLLLNQVRYGLLGAIGGFTYLYVFNEPYAQRVKKIFFIAIGITTSVCLGIFVAPYPALIVLIVGLIGIITTFIFGILKITGPAAVFFILSFTMTTGIKLENSDIPIFIGVVFASSMFSWIVSLMGYFFNPHGPELKKIKGVYLALGEFAEVIGSKDISQVRNRVVNSLREAEEILNVGYNSWKVSFIFNRLVLLNKHANKLFLTLLELNSKSSNELPKELIEMIRKLQAGVDLSQDETIRINKISREFHTEYNKVLEVIYDIESIMNLPLRYIGHSIEIKKPSITIKFIKAINKDSIVFVNSIRYGIVLSVSAIVAFYFPFTRPYWITLSCAAVMCGSTIMATFHRAIQRSVGTIIGIVLAIAILSFQPQGFMVVVVNMCLTALIELAISRNYALAAIFITPNSILIAENSTQIHNIGYFATARITDIIVGSAIGLIGTYIIGRKSASSRLPDLMAKLLRSHSRVLVFLASNNSDNDTNAIREKMEIDHMNFKMAYNTALGEIPNNEEMLEMMWPAFYSLEHISYLLTQYCSEKGHISIKDDELAKLILIYETMANNMEQRNSIKLRTVEIIKEISELCEEINNLQSALSIKN
ncbi:FUSC family protein [Clostridium saccharoperbutylacetonicum]|uniref:FUSC family protein n=1 Tax=Clostridium saccharoperbutylacetonicum TaxID=36745 RepID=UPI000983A6AD|nr:FUSC family protein [Clostridium saccharoperbutylacetonicum]AQR95427.1 inner membrane protein YccS [Clostridium saccharoperbutylacetonicum]NSB31286.1 putative membrane protein YccC [Clostridium saccharoperbutylacetonicum]